MFSFFPVFAWFIQNISDYNINIGFLREPNDSDFSDGIVIGCSRSEENQEIKDQGFENEYRLRIDFTYNIQIFSQNSEAECNEIATEFLELLPPGEDIHITYDGSDYDIYLNKINDKIEYNLGMNHWLETLTISGFTYSKII
jgi:hypothetical protein